MSLVLVAASSQYAVKTSFTAPAARPLAFGCMFKATAAATQGIIGIFNNGDDINRLVVRNNAGGPVTHTDYAQGNLADYTSSNNHTLNDWNYVQGAFLTAASRNVHLNGTKTNNTTNVSVYPSTLNAFALGALITSAVGNYFNGKIAHAWVADAWQDAWAAELQASASPVDVIGASLLHYWPLASDYTDSVGGVTLSGVNSPTFDAADQPAVISGESDPWAVAYPAGRSPGVAPYDNPRLRGRRQR